MPLPQHIPIHLPMMSMPIPTLRGRLRRLENPHSPCLKLRGRPAQYSRRRDLCVFTPIHDPHGGGGVGGGAVVGRDVVVGLVGEVGVGCLD